MSRRYLFDRRRRMRSKRSTSPRTTRTSARSRPGSMPVRAASPTTNRRSLRTTSRRSLTASLVASGTLVALMPSLGISTLCFLSFPHHSPSASLANLTCFFVSSFAAQGYQGSLRTRFEDGRQAHQMNLLFYLGYILPISRFGVQAV